MDIAKDRLLLRESCHLSSHSDRLANDLHHQVAIVAALHSCRTMRKPVCVRFVAASAQGA
eukprot:2655448-Heterocapsa_arctica.AAC.1